MFNKGVSYTLRSSPRTIRRVTFAIILSIGVLIPSFAQAATVQQMAPTNVQAITGGKNIAILWDMPAGNIKQVYVYRNNTKVASVTPGIGVLTAQKLGTSYIDNNVIPGQTYQYKVVAVNTSNISSGYSNISQVIDPVRTSAVPNVTIDASQATDLTSYLTTYIKPEIETWYPKMADALAFPDYQAKQNINILVDSSNTGVSQVGAQAATGGTISINPSWLRANLADGGGVFLHESTHILQAYPSNPTSWATDGIADWVRNWFTRERYKSFTPAPNGQLSNSYSDSAYMLQWAQTKYSPGLIRKLNIALHNGTYTNDFMTKLTGKTAEQLYAEAKATHYTADVGPIKGIAGKCVDISGRSSANGAKVQLYTCNGTTAQKWQRVYKDVGLDAGYLGATKTKFYLVDTSLGNPNGRCIDVTASGTLNGTKVHSWDCGFGTFRDAQIWTQGSSNSLVNPNSNRCLSTSGYNASQNGNQLIIWDCKGYANQRWTLLS